MCIAMAPFVRLRLLSSMRARSGVAPAGAWCLDCRPKEHADQGLAVGQPACQKLGQLEYEVLCAGVAPESRGQHDLAATRRRDRFQPIRAETLEAGPGSVQRCFGPDAQFELDRLEARRAAWVRWSAGDRDTGSRQAFGSTGHGHMAGP